MTVAGKQTIYAGDTSEAWEIGHDLSSGGAGAVQLAALDGNYSLRLVVPHPTAEIDRMVAVKNDANTRFIAWLTPAETLALGKGTWPVGLELRNTTLTPPLVREIHEVVEIRAALVPPPA